jgi:hypothetical protein
MEVTRSRKIFFIYFLPILLWIDLWISGLNCTTLQHYTVTELFTLLHSTKKEPITELMTENMKIPVAAPYGVASQGERISGSPYVRNAIMAPASIPPRTPDVIPA